MWEGTNNRFDWVVGWSVSPQCFLKVTTQLPLSTHPFSLSLVPVLFYLLLFQLQTYVLLTTTLSLSLVLPSPLSATNIHNNYILLITILSLCNSEGVEENERNKENFTLWDLSLSFPSLPSLRLPPSLSSISPLHSLSPPSAFILSSSSLPFPPFHVFFYLPPPSFSPSQISSLLFSEEYYVYGIFLYFHFLPRVIFILLFSIPSFLLSVFSNLIFSLSSSPSSFIQSILPVLLSILPFFSRPPFHYFRLFLRTSNQ